MVVRKLRIGVNNKQEKSDYWWLVPLILTLIVLGHYFTFLFVGESFYTHFNDVNASDTVKESILNSKGLLGDFSSGHFTFLAFIWMTYAVIIQRKEYGLQRNEYVLQREEFKGQTAEFKLQRHQFEEQNLHVRYNRLQLLLSELFYNTEYTVNKQGHHVTRKGMYALFSDMGAKPDNKQVLEQLEIPVKFITSYYFIQNELDSLSDKYDTEETRELQDVVKNLKKEFILQWKDIFVRCYRTYLMLAIVTFQNEVYMKSYFHLEFIQPLLEKKTEIISEVYDFDLLNQEKLIHLVASVKTETLSQYFKLEYVDFDVYVQ